MKWVVYLALAVCLLLLVSVVLNNVRWWYYREGVYVLDKWTGKSYRVSDKARPAPYADTSFRVFEIAGGIGLAVLTIGSFVRWKRRG
jgi:hypothetical protein